MTIYILKAVSFLKIYSVLNLPPVVQTLDSTIHRINYYPADNIREINCTIHWVEIYLVDSVIQLLNNWTLVYQEHPTSILGKYLFERRFEI